MPAVRSVLLLQTYVYNDLYLYNIKTGEWSLLKAPNPPAPRCAHQVCLLSYSNQTYESCLLFIL